MSGVTNAGEVLICDEVLFSLALMLGPLGTWRLQTVSTRLRKAISIDSLPHLRKIWISSSIQGDTPLVDLVRAASPSVSPHQQRALLQACGRWLLLHPGAALSPDHSGQTPLTWAADYGLQDVLRLLLSPIAGEPSEFPVALALKESNGWYPLFRAAWGGRSECVRLLLAAHADPEGLEGKYSPLMSAARWGHQEAVSLLLDAQASPDRKNVYGEDAVMLARGQNHTAVVQLLKQALEFKGSCSDVEPQNDWLSRVNSTRARHTMGDGWAALGKDFYISSTEQ